MAVLNSAFVVVVDNAVDVVVAVFFLMSILEEKDRVYSK